MMMMMMMIIIYPNLNAADTSLITFRNVYILPDYTM